MEIIKFVRDAWRHRKPLYPRSTSAIWRRRAIGLSLVAVVGAVAGTIASMNSAGVTSKTELANSGKLQTGAPDSEAAKEAAKGKALIKGNGQSSLPGTPGGEAPAIITPSTALNLSNWKLTLPTDSIKAGKPDEITQPKLATYSQAPYFVLSGQAVSFRAPVGGVTTSGSSYPRSELREMMSSGGKEASWSNTSGEHSMTIHEAITHLPAVKREVVAGQIHDASDDVIEIRLNGGYLYVENDGKDIGVLNSNYGLGTAFTVKIVATGGRIKVSYDGTQKIDTAISGSGWYFKAGCYTQSNPSKGDSPSDYGEVVIYNLTVSHS